MKTKGFYIKSVISTGEGMKTARVDFKEGCNLLFGPSDSGKSTVFSVIEFMLGKFVDKSNKVPKPVTEGRGYDTYYMEIVTLEDDTVHTFRRKEKDNNVLVRDCAYEQFDTCGQQGQWYPIRNKTKKTLSAYLMELNGFDDGLEVKSSTTNKTRLTYSLIRHLVLADENRIISENPIFNPTGQRTDNQKEKSLIYYLTTGDDDSGFEEQEKDEIRKSRYKGMISLTEEEIELVKGRIEKLGDVSYADFNDDSAVKALETRLKEEEEKLNKLYEERKVQEEALRKMESRRLFNAEFVKRMEMLQKHYETDLGRYEYLFEGASLFEMLPNDKECPICHSRIANKSAIDTSYLAAIQGEYDKLKAKIADVRELVAKKPQTIGSMIQKIEKTQTAIRVTDEKIKMFATQMAGIKETLRQYQKNIEKKAESNYLASELSRLLKKLDKLNKEQTQKPAVEPYIRQTDIKEDFCRELKEKLVAWNLLRENDTVVFDENGFDFILGAKDRLSCGKGSRGVTCSAILMTLVEYCHKKDIPFSNFLVIDSPITAHYDGEDMEVDETTQTKFFKYCNDTAFDYQLILIDNKAPDEVRRGELSNIHYIQFTKEKGFYLGKE